MSNYFDNQNKWSWQISDKTVLVTTDHGNHTHTMEITNVPIGEMVDNTGKVMGDAHRSVSHDFKEDTELVENTETNTLVDNVDENNNVNDIIQTGTIEDASAVPSVDNNGEDCEDGLDI
jgi:hypothetical protein